MKKNIIDKLLNSEVSELSRYVEHSMAIVAQITDELIKKGWKKKDLAKALGKYESEVSKLLCGNHNFSLKTIAKIEQALNKQLVYVKLELPEQPIKQLVYVHQTPRTTFRIKETSIFSNCDEDDLPPKFDKTLEIANVEFSR